VKKILYIDMDNVIVDFRSGIMRLSQEVQDEFAGNLDDVPGIFSLMDPMPGAIESVRILSQHFDTYVLSTAPWGNPSAWRDKVEWIHHYFKNDDMATLKDPLGNPLWKRLILSHHKNLNQGDFLIDDRLAHGVDRFSGEHIHFGNDRWPDWECVTKYLLKHVANS
jgi:5'(3')-deoxyribonucleotidase